MRESLSEKMRNKFLETLKLLEYQFFRNKNLIFFQKKFLTWNYPNPPAGLGCNVFKIDSSQLSKRHGTHIQKYATTEPSKSPSALARRAIWCHLFGQARDCSGQSRRPFTTLTVALRLSEEQPQTSPDFSS